MCSSDLEAPVEVGADLVGLEKHERAEEGLDEQDAVPVGLAPAAASSSTGSHRCAWGEWGWDGGVDCHTS